MRLQRTALLLAISVIASTAASRAGAYPRTPREAASPGTLTRLVLQPHAAIGSRVSATVERQAGNMTRVELQSSNTAVATVPSHIWVQRGATSASFDVTPVSGPGGCATITARDPDNAVTARFFTYPGRPSASSARLQLAPGSQHLPQYDATVDGVTSFRGIISGTSEGRTWTLQSSAPEVTVPARVTVPAGANTVEFTASVRGAPHCVLVTATEGRTTISRLLVFVNIGG